MYLFFMPETIQRTGQSSGRRRALFSPPAALCILFLKYKYLSEFYNCAGFPRIERDIYSELD